MHLYGSRKDVVTEHKKKLGPLLQPRTVPPGDFQSPAEEKRPIFSRAKIDHAHIWKHDNLVATRNLGLDIAKGVRPKISYESEKILT